MPSRTFVLTPIPRSFITDYIGPFRNRVCMFIIAFELSRPRGSGAPEWREKQWSRRSFLRGSVPKSQRKAMGDARKTDAISLEEFPEAEVRISHSRCVQRVLGAKDSVPSQASFCNVEGSENRKETAEEASGKPPSLPGTVRERADKILCVQPRVSPHPSGLLPRLRSLQVCSIPSLI